MSHQFQENMTRRLPPLNALRAFEAAGRHGSFVRAAAELHVTHGAISRQVKVLEEHFGAPLFERRHRGVTLTEAGVRLLATLREAFDRIEETALGVARADGQPLVVACLATMSLRWLVPRLGRFHARHPDVRLRLVTAADQMDIERDGLDVRIDVGRVDDRPGACIHAFAADEFGPVCSPALVAARPPSHVRELAAHAALHTKTRPALWDDYLIESGAGPVRFADSQMFDHLYLALQAAVAGLGVAIGPRLVVADDLRGGRLVAPFGFISRAGRVSAVIHRAGRCGDPRIAALIEWLRDEAAA
jgi:LysR family transcriptional regulator, glycine cleavage system transcriptional activator